MVFFLFCLKSKNTYHEGHEDHYFGHRSTQINDEKENRSTMKRMKDMKGKTNADTIFISMIAHRREDQVSLGYWNQFIAEKLISS